MENHKLLTSLELPSEEVQRLNEKLQAAEKKAEQASHLPTDQPVERPGTA